MASNNGSKWLSPVTEASPGQDTILSVDIHLQHVKHAIWKARSLWKDIGRALGLLDGDINSIRYSNDGECLHEVLSEWMYTGRATTKNLLKALEDRTVNRTDIANEIRALKVGLSDNSKWSVTPPTDPNAYRRGHEAPSITEEERAINPLRRFGADAGDDSISNREVSDDVHRDRESSSSSDDHKPIIEENKSSKKENSKHKASRTTNGNIRQATTTHCCKPKWIFLSVTISLCSVGIVLSLTGTIGFAVYGGLHSTSSTRVLAKGGDSVIVDTITDPLWLVFYSVTECLRGGDDSHSNELYLIEEDQLIQHTRSHVRDSPEIYNQSEPSCKTGFLGTGSLLYLLSGSTIEYRICLSTNGETAESGKLFIFDDDVSYELYINQGYPCTEDQVARKHDLIIGTQGNFKCTNILFTASVNGYHYVVSRTPGNIRFNYTYNVNMRYLDPTDFSDKYCTFNSVAGNTCVLPRLSTNIVVVDYVIQNRGSDPVTTHVCLERSWRPWLIAIIVLFGVLLVIVTFIVVFLCYKYRSMLCGCTLCKCTGSA